MTKTKVGRRVSYTLFALMALLVLSAGAVLLLPVRGGQANAYSIMIPGEFRGTVGGEITGFTYESEPAKAQNYKGGYTIKKVSDNSLLKVVANKNVALNGTTLVETNFTAAELATKSDDSNTGDSIFAFYRGGNDRDIDVGGWPGFGSRAEYETKFKAVEGSNNNADYGFKLRAKAAYIKLYNNGLRDGNTYAAGDFNIGISKGGIDTWGGTAPKVEYWYGDTSTYNKESDQQGVMILVYNNVADDFYVLHSTQADKWSQGEDRNVYGLPYSNSELASALRADGITLPLEVLNTEVVQVFKNRIIKADGTTIVGEYNSTTKTFGDSTSDEITLSVYNRMGSKQSYTTVAGEAGYKHHFYNYEKGSAYAYVKDSDKSFTGVQQFGGAQFNMATVTSGVTKTSAFTREEARDKVSVISNIENSEVREQDSTSSDQVTTLIGNYGITKTMNDLYPKFKAKWAEMRTAGINPGLAVTGVKVWDGLIMQEMTLGDSSSSRDDRVGYAWLVYDIGNDRVHYVKSEFINYIAGNRDRQEQNGYFISDSHKVVTVAGSGNKTVLLAEKGYYELNGSTVTWTAGKRYDEGTQSFVAVPTFRTSDYGALTGASYAAADGYTYQNLRNAFVKYRFVNNSYEYIYKANFNFSVASDVISTAPVAESIYLAGLDSIAFASSGGDNVTDILPNLTEPDKTAMRASLKAAVKAAVESGWSIGIKISDIKQWDGIVVVEYKFGDGDMYHDGSPTSSRSKMSIVVLDLDSREFYVVTKHALVYGQSAKSSLSYAVSAHYASKTVKLGGNNITLNEVQFFRAGYMHIVNGATKVVTGYEYSAANGGTLSAVAAPSVPEGYGKLNERFTDSHGNVYLNYAKGCVLAKVNLTGFGYYYVSHYGRKYNTETYALEKIEIQNLVAVADFKLGVTKPSGFTGTNDEFSKLFYDAYVYWHGQNFMLGKIDDVIKSWKGNSWILQFMFGDSVGDPFGDSRANVAALSYNNTTGEVYLITDCAVDLLNDNGGAGTPIENPVFHENLGVYTQRFSSTSGSEENIGNNYMIWNKTSGSFIKHEDQSYDDFIANSAKKGSTHGKNVENGYIAVGGEISYSALNLPQSVSTKVAAAAAAVSSASLIGFAGFMFFDKKKKFGSKLLGRIK